MTAIFRRELRSYFTGMTGYLYAAFILLFTGIYTMVYNLTNGYSEFEYVLEAISFVFMLACPIITMRTFSEEKHSGTDRLLYSLPITMTKVVLAKYLAMLVVMLVPVAVMCVYPLILAQFGNVSLRTAYAAIFMFWLLGAALGSIGMFISSITENQVISAVITLIAVLVIYFMSGLASYISDDASSSLTAFMALALVLTLIMYAFSRNFTLCAVAFIVIEGGLLIAYTIKPDAFEGLFAACMQQISLFNRFYTIIDGVFDLTAIVYYVSIAAVFNFITVQALEKRRWN